MVRKVGLPLFDAATAPQHRDDPLQDPLSVAGFCPRAGILGEARPGGEVTNR